ncbi:MULTISPECIES: cysteine hydrolase family protein [unclassified Mameliella]|uniref:cysteine hydrolase family protein n=1 Tax=unclassified Mameliella TaxID=2630630 RepID=UPI00273EAA7E|nr:MULTISPECIES: isochorismatase family cysteine hydrolase [unclassified Mameliella]
MTQPFLSTTSRDIPLQKGRVAVLFVDVQNFCLHPEGGEIRDATEAERRDKLLPFIDRFRARALPQMQALQQAARAAGVEVMYTTIESLTKDGRDRSLDYKITGFNVPKGSFDAKVIDELAPGEDEIVLPKSSSSVFVSTHIDYVLRNLGVAQLVVSGVVTDQCVESAIRDACDLGYLVTQVTDACATYTDERHDASLRAIQGYCRQMTLDQLLPEFEALRAQS